MFICETRRVCLQPGNVCLRERQHFGHCRLWAVGLSGLREKGDGQIALFSDKYLAATIVISVRLLVRILCVIIIPRLMSEY